MQVSNRIAIIYDFDGTLAQGNIQEPVLLKELGIDTDFFWKRVRRISRKNNADQILVYLQLLLQECVDRGVSLKRTDLELYGKQASLFRGVKTWFDKINDHCNTLDCHCYHFIISSGNQELIKGTPIAKHFKYIFASSFLFNEHDVAYAPGVAINSTAKLQYLRHISTAYYDLWNPKVVNKYRPPNDWDIPYTNMIYIGDGLTDIPCFEQVKRLGGHSVAVYNPFDDNPEKLFETQSFMYHHQVNAFFKADYSDNHKLSKYIKAIITSISNPQEAVSARRLIEKIEKECHCSLPIKRLAENDANEATYRQDEQIE